MSTPEQHDGWFCVPDRVSLKVLGLRKSGRLFTADRHGSFTARFSGYEPLRQRDGQGRRLEWQPGLVQPQFAC